MRPRKLTLQKLNPAFTQLRMLTVLLLLANLLASNSETHSLQSFQWCDRAAHLPVLDAEAELVQGEAMDCSHALPLLLAQRRVKHMDLAPDPDTRAHNNL